MIYGCLIAHFTLTSTVHFAHHSWYQTWEGGVFNQPDLHLKQKEGSATTDLVRFPDPHYVGKSVGESDYYWFTFTVFSARLSNWNSSGQIRQPLLCLTYFQQEVIFLTIFCYIFETQSALKGLWNIGEATVDWRFWPICHRISFASFCSQRPFTGKVIETSAQISLQRIKVVRSSFYPASNISGEKICTHAAQRRDSVARIQQVSVCCKKATLAWVWESLKKSSFTRQI